MTLTKKSFVHLTGIFLMASAFTMGVRAATPTDRKIESSIKNSYVYKKYLKGDNVKVQSQNGVVTLKGTVESKSNKTLIEETAANTPGVKYVENMVVINENQSAGSDKWLEAKIKVTLMFHKSVNAGKTNVAVSNGDVTLTGEAESQGQKDLTTQYAQDIDGVTSINNNMQVVNSKPQESLGDKIDDASITAQVKTALLFHRSTSAIRTDVATKEGVVSIRGLAHNDAEKVLVTKLASDIEGVKDVLNNMTVESGSRG